MGRTKEIALARWIRTTAAAREAAALAALENAHATTLAGIASEEKMAAAKLLYVGVGAARCKLMQQAALHRWFETVAKLNAAATQAAHEQHSAMLEGMIAEKTAVVRARGATRGDRHGARGGEGRTIELGRRGAGALLWVLWAGEVVVGWSIAKR